jgi:acyl-CoA thioester hydrolase
MRNPPASRTDYLQFRSHTTRWNDNDVYGHLNNVVHYLLFDTTVNEWLIGRRLLDIQNSPAIALVAETGCRYRAEMAFPQVITAGLRVAKLGRSSVRYEIGLFSDDCQTAAAEGFFVHVYVDARTHRPCDIPEATRVALLTLVKEGS